MSSNSIRGLNRGTIARAVCVASFLIVNAANAATSVEWQDTSVSGNWSDATKWSPAVIPNGAYDVSLPAGNETVTLLSPVTINSLTTGNVTHLQLDNGGQLTTSSLDHHGQLILNDGSAITVTGTTNSTGYIQMWNNASASFGDLNLSGFGGVDLNNNICNINGTLTCSDYAIVLVGGNTTLNVRTISSQASLFLFGTMNITGGGSGYSTVPVGTSITLYGTGAVNVINGSVSTDALANLSDVSGRMHLQTGQVRNWNSMNVSGSLSASGTGTVLNIQSINNTGTVSASSNAVINIASGLDGTTIPAGSSYEAMEGGTINRIVGGVPINAFENLANINGNLLLQDQKTYNWGPLNVNGNFVINDNVTTVNTTSLNNHGSISLFYGANLNITGGPQITDVPADASYEVWSNGFNYVSGGVSTPAFANLSTVEGNVFLAGGPPTFNWGTITNSGHLQIGRSDLNISGDVHNTGAFGLGDGEGSPATTNVSGTFNNAAGASFGISRFCTVNLNALNNSGEISIGGKLYITGGGPAITDIPSTAKYLLSGDFDVVNGSIHTPALANLSTIEGQLLIWEGDYQFNHLDNSGDVELISGTMGMKSLRHNGQFYANTLVTIGTGTSSLASGLQIFPDGSLTMVLHEPFQYSPIQMFGENVMLDGTLHLELVSGYIPSPGDSFDLIYAYSNNITGTFSSVQGVPYPGGEWQIQYDSANGVVRAVAVPEPLSIGWLGMGSLCMLRRRSRSR